MITHRRDPRRAAEALLLILSSGFVSAAAIGPFVWSIGYPRAGIALVGGAAAVAAMYHLATRA